MAFPSSVTQLPSTLKSSRKSRAPAQSDSVEDDPGVGVGGPILDFGRPGGARLNNEGGKWRWVWASEERTGTRLRTDDIPLLLFPGTRKPEEHQEGLTVEKKLVAATEYFSDILEDFDQIGVQELVAQEINEAHKQPSERTQRRGRVLEIIHNGKADIAKTIVCFPMGEVGNHLNISPYLPRSLAARDARTIRRFAPMAKPSFSFPTEILQLCSSPVVSLKGVDPNATALIVRIHSSTHLLRLTPSHGYSPDSDNCPVIIDTLGVLTPEDTAGFRHADVALDPTTFCRALIVDEGGGVWLWSKQRVGKTNTKELHLKQVRQPLGAQKAWYQVAFGTRSGTAIVMSERDIVLLDRQGTAPPVTLITLSGRGRVFTSLEKTALPREATYTAACTTFEVMWFDESQPGVPLLSWTHDYGGGEKDDLDVTMIRWIENDRLVLSSATDPMIMVFDVPPDPPLQSRQLPQVLPIPTYASGPLTSLAVLDLERGEHSSPKVLLGMSKENGSLWSVPLIDTAGEGSPAHVSRKKSKNNLRNTGSGLIDTTFEVDWNDDVHMLAETGWPGVDEDRMHVGKDTKKHQEYDMRWAWNEINSPDVIEGVPDFAVRDLEQYLRESDAPLEHFMTAGEIARDMVYGESSSLRSSILLPLPPARPGTGDEIDRLDFSRHLPFAHRFLDFPTADALSDTYLQSADFKKYPSLRRKAEKDIAALATELALSRAVLHSDMLSLPDHRHDLPISLEDGVTRAARALTLHDTPRPVEFSYLIPKPATTESETISPSSPAPPGEGWQHNEGARAILGEWTLGSDPTEYQWQPWRQRDGPPSRASPVPGRAIRPLPSPRAAPPRFGITPVIRTSSDLYIARLPPAIARSSPPPELPSSGAEGLFTSTQVEPGRYGGRAGGKKKVKKRVGGF